MSLLPLLVSAVLTQAGAQPIVRAGDLALTGAEVTARALDFKRSQSAQVPAPAAFVDGLVDELLLAADAQRTGLASKPDALASVEAERAKTLAREYWEREFLAKTKPPEAAVRELFHETRDTVRLQLLVLSTRAEADAARARLAAGGDFALESARSLHPSSANRGDTGTLGRRGMDPALAKAAFEAPKETLFGPIELSLGFAVGKVLERTVADESAFPAERPTLEAWVRRQFAGQARAHFLEMSRRKRGVVLDEKFLESLGKSMETTPAQADHAIASIDGRPVRYGAIAAEVREWATSGGSHMFGPSVRIRVATLHLDNLLLSAAARDAGIEKDPAVAAAIRMSEIAALARARAEQLQASAPASASPRDRDRLIRKALETLRKQIPTSVDRPAAIAATERAFSATPNSR